MTTKLKTLPTFLDENGETEQDISNDQQLLLEKLILQQEKGEEVTIVAPKTAKEPVEETPEEEAPAEEKKPKRKRRTKKKAEPVEEAPEEEAPAEEEPEEEKPAKKTRRRKKKAVEFAIDDLVEFTHEDETVSGTVTEINNEKYVTVTDMAGEEWEELKTNLKKITKLPKTTAAMKKEAEKSKAKKKAAGAKKTGGIKKVGVIAAIVEILTKATKKKPVTKEDILTLLEKQFPDRATTSMMGTINVQVPSRLKKEKDLNILNDGKGYYTV